MLRSLSPRFARYTDWLIGIALFLFTFAIYLRTLAPSVAEMFDDSLEFQLVAQRMAIAHPTGYPLFSILLKLFTFLPVGDVAYRVNVATALFGALAVSVLFAAARQVIDSRVAPALAALVFAFGETFWSQAVLAEVYTLQALLTAAMLWLTLAWAADLKDRSPHGRIPLTAIALFCGLMLTHHRLSILLFPAVAVYVLSYDRSFLREPRTLVRLALSFVFPLLLYLYIPLRGLYTSSLDGTYQNTPTGFVNWILASGYDVFLTQNPFNENRDAAYFFDLFIRQFTWAGLALASIGFITLARHRWREWLLLTVALAANVAFAVSYRVPDVAVFFIPSFMLVTLFVAVGADWLAQLPSNVLTNTRLYAPLSTLLLALVLILPFSLIQANLRSVDLSGKWDVHDYGRDILAQPLPPNSTIVGILGEVTLIRYFQETENLRRDVQTVAADKELARLSAIANDLQSGHVVLLTRQLSGVEKKYSLASFGPLILVQAKPNSTVSPSPAHPLDEDFGGVRLIGYDIDPSRLAEAPNWHLDTGRRLRVTLYWHVQAQLTDDRYVSLKLLAPNGTRGGQLDRRPVLDTYPTTAWRVGEFISDTYDLPIFEGAPPGEYTLQATLYNPNTGEVHGQKDLATIALAPDTHDHSGGFTDIDRLRLRDFGGLLLVGYSLDNGAPYAPGSQIPVTLLWRATTANVQRNLELRLVNANDQAVASRAFTLGGADVRVGQYLRQELALTVPEEQPRSSPIIELDNAPRDYFACELPYFSPCIVLAKVQVRK